MQSIFLTMTRLAAWTLLLAALVVTAVPPLLRPVSGFGHDLEHFTLFLLLGAAFGLGYRRYVYSIGLALLLFTGALEVLQIFIPGRHARVSDFVIDGLAVCIGLAIGTRISRIVPAA
jgi:VanZ family protein